MHYLTIKKFRLHLFPFSNSTVCLQYFSSIYTLFLLYILFLLYDNEEMTTYYKHNPVGHSKQKILIYIYLHFRYENIQYFVTTHFSSFIKCMIIFYLIYRFFLYSEFYLNNPKSISDISYVP